ncbi:MAG: Acyl-CoA dehydrogenase, long-chain specific, mitochondrial precursor [Frankiales bacterium]|nr:Acyl-CoA dehydrogenase, long-chain specific, mitochondrial precursor [Frankiales bacterium]
MYLDYTPAQHELRDQLRAYFAGLLTPAVKEAIATEGHNGPTSLEVRQKMGADGWLGIGWPREYGGQGRSVLEQFVFFDEATRAQAPVPMIALNTVGPTLMRHGSDEQKDAFLPRILAGTLDVAIGYTEPGSGTDLASLRTKAERQGDEFVVNGNKVYTTGGLTADYVWLAARTNPDAPKHKGISILLVDTKTPGFSATPIVTVGGEVTSATYYEDVHVPASMVVGNVDEGWRLITSQLNHERVALAAMGGRSLELFEAVRQWAVDEGVIEVPWVRQTLARVYARLDALKLLNWRMAWKTDAGTLTPADASAGKVFGSETDIESYRLLLEIIGRAGMVQKGSPAAELAGVLEKAYRSAPVRTFGGGSNEVQREILVQTALGLPRGAR